MMLRKAIIKDLETIDALYTQGGADEVKLQYANRKRSDILNEFNKNRSSRRELFKKGIISKKEIWIVAEEKGSIIGFAQGYIEINNNEKIGLLDKIYVNSSHRGKGVGTRLGRQLMKQLKEKGINYYEGRLYAKNTASIKLQEKLGFSPFSIRFRKKA